MWYNLYMKICTECKETKPLEEFQKRSSSKDGHTNLCKPCKRSYDNNHYNNSHTRKEYIRSNQDRREKETNKYIVEYLLTHPCVDCGESDIIVLEFDHVRGDKRGNISILKRSSLKAVKEEIEKCEVRCANCHRRKTAKQFGWTNKFASFA
jgi:hypothetical protein